MSNKNGTDGSKKTRRTKPKWVFRRVLVALSEDQSKMLDALVEKSLETNPMASMTTVMQRGLVNEYNSVFPSE